MSTYLANLGTTIVNATYSAGNAITSLPSGAISCAKYAYDGVTSIPSGVGTLGSHAVSFVTNMGGGELAARATLLGAGIISISAGLVHFQQVRHTKPGTVSAQEKKMQKLSVVFMFGGGVTLAGLGIVLPYLVPQLTRGAVQA